MNKQESIDKIVEETIESASTLNKVEISPFVKDKTLNRLYETDQEHSSQNWWSLLMPQIQLAVLVVIIAVNVFALVKIKNEAYANEVSDFAESYGFSSDSNETFLSN